MGENTAHLYSRGVGTAAVIKGGEFLDWVKEAERLKFDEGKSWGQTARTIWKYFPHLTEHQVFEKVRRRLRESPRYKPVEAEAEHKGSIEYKSDGTMVYDKIIEICENEDMTPEFMLKAHGLDVEKWKIISYRNNFWHSQIRGGKRLVMYQSKITVKPYEDNEISLETAKRVFRELQSEYKPKKVNYIKPSKPRLLEVNIADLHLGKLAWRGECGEDYDFKIATERFNYAIDDIVSRAKNIEKIIFPIGNDFFNSDTVNSTTTKGTIQTNDLRWQKMYKVGCGLLTDAVDKLRQVAPIECFYVSSNHDKMTSFYATLHLGAFFHNVKGVDINTSALYRKYIEYYNTLIGFSHGAEEGKRIHKLMQTEAREAWGRTKYHEFHLAHIHSEKAVESIAEDGGLIIRYVSSVTGTDSWHSESGFVGAVKKAQNFIYDREKGLVEILNTVV